MSLGTQRPATFSSINFLQGQSISAFASGAADGKNSPSQARLCSGRKSSMGLARQHPQGIEDSRLMSGPELEDSLEESADASYTLC
jgi:hypothetical protein